MFNLLFFHQKMEVSWNGGGPNPSILDHFSRMFMFFLLYKQTILGIPHLRQLTQPTHMMIYDVSVKYPFWKKHMILICSMFFFRVMMFIVLNW